MTGTIDSACPAFVALKDMEHKEFHTENHQVGAIECWFGADAITSTSKSIDITYIAHHVSPTPVASLKLKMPKATQSESQ